MGDQGMQREMTFVREFHEKMQISPTQPMQQTMLGRLDSTSDLVLAASKELEHWGKFDERYTRMHLIFEEAAELGKALAEANEVEAVDGLCDLLYVCFGTAVAFDWPIVNAFNEIHMSNMTKEKQPDDPSSHRVRSKGPNYRAPDIARILQMHRGK
jgi:predicted HAD superfamily Cof-like phosphohydrolase